MDGEIRAAWAELGAECVTDRLAGELAASGLTRPRDAMLAMLVDWSTGELLQP